MNLLNRLRSFFRMRQRLGPLGEPARRVLDEFKRAGNENEHVRWALANALTVIADRTMIAEIEALLSEERNESVARVLNSAMVKAKKRKS